MEGILFGVVPIMIVLRHIYREVEFSSDGGLIAAYWSWIDVLHSEPKVVVMDVAGRDPVVAASTSMPRWLQ